MEENKNIENMDRFRKGIWKFAERKAKEQVYAKINSMDIEEIEIEKRQFFKDLNQVITKHKYLIKDVRIEIDWKKKGGNKK